MTEHSQHSAKQTESHKPSENAPDFENEWIPQFTGGVHDFAASSGAPVDPKNVLNMQTTFGNRATQQLLRKPQIPQPNIKAFNFINRMIQREPHALEQIESSGSSPHQDLDTGGRLTPVYAQAWEVAFQEYKPKVETIARRLKGAEAQVAPLKGRERASEKAQNDYKGDTTSLVDIARASIVCQTAGDVLKAWEMVNEEFTVVRVKNRFANPADGYRDLMINVELSNNHVAELQIHLQAIIDVKSGDGHKLYERVRVLEAQGNLSGEEQKELAEKKAQMEQLYNAAWEEAKKIPDK